LIGRDIDSIQPRIVNISRLEENGKGNFFQEEVYFGFGDFLSLACCLIQ
jgi:hypothetical protein